MTESEFELAVSRIRSGDKEGLKDIYLAYVKFIYAVIFGVLRSKENAEDVTSDFFIKLWDVADSYKPGGGHRAYLAAIARNMAIDWIRKHKREVLLSEENPDIGDMAGSAGDEGMSGGVRTDGSAGTVIAGSMAEGDPESAVTAVGIRQALDTLKEGERQIVNLKILGDLTFREIAELLHMPMGTVTWKYQNAISKLRRCGYE